MSSSWVTLLLDNNISVYCWICLGLIWISIPFIIYTFIIYNNNKKRVYFNKRNNGYGYIDILIYLIIFGFIIMNISIFIYKTESNNNNNNESSNNNNLYILLSLNYSNKNIFTIIFNILIDINLLLIWLFILMRNYLLLFKSLLNEQIISSTWMKHIIDTKTELLWFIQNRQKFGNDNWLITISLIIFTVIFIPIIIIINIFFNIIIQHIILFNLLYLLTIIL